MAPVPYSRMYLLDRPDVSPSTCPMIHESCQGELNKLYQTEKQQSVLKNKLKRRIDFFQSHPSDFSNAYPLFEPYQTYNDQGTPLPVYVMRFNKDKILGNLRIFFIVQQNEMYMLHAFIERGKKTYGPAYNVVKARLS